MREWRWTILPMNTKVITSVEILGIAGETTEMMRAGITETTGGTTGEGAEGEGGDATLGEEEADGILTDVTETVTTEVEGTEITIEETGGIEIERIGTETGMKVLETGAGLERIEETEGIMRSGRTGVQGQMRSAQEAGRRL